MGKEMQTKAQETFMNVCNAVNGALLGEGLTPEDLFHVLSGASQMIDTLSKTGFLNEPDKTFSI